MQELHTADELAEATDDLLVRWGGQALTTDDPARSGMAWRSSGAVAVHAPQLNRRDRVLFTGSADDCADLLAEVLPELPGERVRPLAPTALAHQVAERLDLDVAATFGWMHLAAEPPRARPDAEWVADEQEVADLLRIANPTSWLVPGDPGAVRWAGVRDASGRLLSVGADSWPAPGIRFLAGVATAPEHRGTGLSTVVCSFLARELAREGAVTLMVDADNAAALKVYRRLGFSYQAVTALRA
ncbi:GNAT family N-acetyltransferase [Saccharopolyspora sp. HNM0983]|uniref:GNAT family N-acetyltransferase n=1 Tax=Saccharopolyspora montiporae TaxID=2781240 RepID=A0A929BAF9_9PSEU|nr:GNAT family N-acetyltransferase [Saccharopolyspora sp. HNM0983]MBE9373992.1 GNAT family N-acetyltransferase [Saccharopolyspora sp. HNM0983]